MYKALDVAHYIIERCYSNNNAVSNLKLQKILYFVQAEFLVSKNCPCFDDEIQAWDFGPVVPNVYFVYKVFGSANIPCFGNSGVSNKLLTQDKKMMNEIIDECVKFSASALVEITHNQTPWIEAYNRPGYNNIISTKSIKKFFTENE